MGKNHKTIVITGCNGGIGKAAALALSKGGHRIIMLVRQSEKSTVAFEEISAVSENRDVDRVYVDLSSFESIVRSANVVKAKYPKIDVLINNAGLFKRKRAISPDGYEMTMAVNYLAPFLLTRLLRPLIEANPEGRVVNVTSELYKSGVPDLENWFLNGRFNGKKAYATSKMFLVLFTQSLARRLGESGCTVNCVHPGVAATDAFREYPAWLNTLLNVVIPKPESAAKPLIDLSISADFATATGRYFYLTKEKTTSLRQVPPDFAEQLFAHTEKLTQLSEG